MSAITLKTGATFVFEGGQLQIFASGHGAYDGRGLFAFQDDDLDFGGAHGETRLILIPATELIALRDFLNKHLATKPRFEKTLCSQCGGEFGPGDSGFSHCDQHDAKARST